MRPRSAVGARFRTTRSSSSVPRCFVTTPIRSTRARTGSTIVEIDRHVDIAQRTQHPSARAAEHVRELDRGLGVEDGAQRGRALFDPRGKGRASSHDADYTKQDSRAESL
jgi:hypothetical protein